MSHPDDGVLQELLDGELAPADEAVVRAHITGCAPCTTALAALKATQVEATAIVSRLELDPPLQRARRVARPARPNLRLLGLAASAVLVAGTSWLLLRSPTAARDRQAADTAAGIILPLPAAEREEVVATTPAAAPAPAPGERADAATAKGKNDAKRPGPKEEVGVAAAVKDFTTEGLDQPLARAQAPAAYAARPSTGAVAGEAPGSSLSLADAEVRFGGRLQTIRGLTPHVIEVVPPGLDSVPRVRQTYLVDGVPVVLVQQRSANAPQASALVSGNERDEMTAKQGLAEPAKMAAAAAPLRLKSWRSGNLMLELEGALPADSLDALMRRVK